MAGSCGLIVLANLLFFRAIFCALSVRPRAQFQPGRSTVAQEAVPHFEQ
jgi:hypothetical protein